MLRTVWARVKRNAGVAGSNAPLGEYLAEWATERQYSPVIGLAGLPDRVSNHLAKAGVELWRAAQVEVAIVLECECDRMAGAIKTEREPRAEALGMVDARDFRSGHPSA